MKKILSLFFVFSILFSFASCSVDRPEVSVAETSSVADDETVTNKVPEKKDAIEFLSVYRNDGYFLRQHPETNESLVDVRYQTLYLSEADSKKYPRLANSVETLNRDKIRTNEETANDFYDFALEQYEEFYEEEYFHTHTAKQKYILQRADNIVLSLRSDYDEYSGGVHPNYGTGGYNYDTVTGKELILTDVMTDISTLPAILSERIRAGEAAEYELFNDLEDTLSEYTAEQFSWTVGYQGVTFYFSPYEIASYAAGLITVTVYFDEYPELFNKKYTIAPDSYASELSAWSDLEFDMNPDDGKRDAIRVGLSYYTEDEMYRDITVIINGNEYTISDLHIFRADFYLVNLSGKYFLYVLPTGYSFCTSLMVYDISDGEFIKTGELDETDFGYVKFKSDTEESIYADAIFNNPSELLLITRFDLLSTYYAAKIYSVNPVTGMPETKDEIYTIPNSETFVITSTADITVKILPELKDETVPAGTDYELIRTDGKTYVDAKLDDGRECRIYVEKINYQLCINGTPEHELFETLYYAG